MTEICHRLDGLPLAIELAAARIKILPPEDAEGEPRFVMLETLHEYAREKLEESGEAEEIRGRHAEFFLALAQEAYPQLIGPEQGRWQARLEAEHENLRSALWQLLRSGQAEQAGRLAGALWNFWRQRGHLREGRQWLGQALASGDLSPPTRARALYGAGVLALFQQDDPAVRPLWEESLSLWRASRMQPGWRAP